jgi:hypothetical protein
MKLGELFYKLQGVVGRVFPQRVLGIKPLGEIPPRGRVLVSYIPLPFWGDPGEIRGHSNVWESSEVVRCFTRLGYVVDVIAWDDSTFIPPAPYTAVFDIHRNLLRYAGKQTLKILHVTGSNPAFSNRAESDRLAALQERRNCKLAPRREILEQDRLLFETHLNVADMVTLIGNDVTLATFPEHIHAKIQPIIATGAWLPPNVTEANLSSRCREFLWFNGSGAVHKGLDLVLDVFARHPELTLHVVGSYLRERDFVDEYRSELFGLPNIHSHGFLYPGGTAFQRLLQRVGLFISPSCSEGISTSAITCMQAGLVPILSRNCGISLPEGVGWLLQESSIAEIEKTIIHSTLLEDTCFTSMAAASRRFALESYSRSTFTARISEVLANVMGESR